MKGSGSPTAIGSTDLARTFKGGIQAVRGIGLCIGEGEIYGFLGPNGAGKSTTVLMLTTLLTPTGGRAEVGGFDVARQPAEVRRIAGVALQDVALDPLLTGREHLRLQAALQGIRGREAVRRTEELLRQVELEGAADRRVSTYSVGMKRRLDLSMALMHRPTVLFLDEPTSGLDPQSRSALWGEVRHLAREDGVTVFLTTHYLEEADALADRVGIVDGGRLVAEGSPAHLKEQIGKPTLEIEPAESQDLARLDALLVPYGELTTSRPATVAVRLMDSHRGLAAVVQMLERVDLPIANLAVHQPTLDDVFLLKTGRPL